MSYVLSRCLSKKIEKIFHRYGELCNFTIQNTVDVMRRATFQKFFKLSHLATRHAGAVAERAEHHGRKLAKRRDPTRKPREMITPRQIYPRNGEKKRPLTANGRFSAFPRENARFRRFDGDLSKRFRRVPSRLISPPLVKGSQQSPRCAQTRQSYRLPPTGKRICRPTPGHVAQNAFQI